MSDIEMTTDDTLELDAIIEEWSDPQSVIQKHNVDSNNYNLNGFKTHTGVFDPQESGTYEFNINGQILSIKVTESSAIPDSGLLYDYRFSGDLTDETGSQNLSEHGTLGYSSTSELGSKSANANGVDNGAYAQLNLVDTYSEFGYVVAFYPSENPDNYAYVCGNGGLNGVITSDQNELACGIYTGSTNFQPIRISDVWKNNQWNVVGYYVDDNASEQGVYVNSSNNLTTDALPDPIQNRNDSYWTVGTRTDDGSNFSNNLDTLVDIALIYDNKNSISNAVDVVADAYGV